MYQSDKNLLKIDPKYVTCMLKIRPEIQGLLQIRPQKKAIRPGLRITINASNSLLYNNTYL